MQCKAVVMEVEEWWPKLSDSAKAWLIANNGDAVPASIVGEIAAAGGVVGSAAGWVGESNPDGFFLSDQATDWIEETANDEA